MSNAFQAGFAVLLGNLGDDRGHCIFRFGYVPTVQMVPAIRASASGGVFAGGDRERHLATAFGGVNSATAGQSFLV